MLLTFPRELADDLAKTTKIQTKPITINVMMMDMAAKEPPRSGTASAILFAQSWGGALKTDVSAPKLDVVSKRVLGTKKLTMRATRLMMTIRGYKVR